MIIYVILLSQTCRERKSMLASRKDSSYTGPKLMRKGFKVGSMENVSIINVDKNVGRVHMSAASVDVRLSCECRM